MSSRRAPLYGVPPLPSRVPALHGTAALAAAWVLAVLLAGGTTSPHVAAYADGAPPGFTGGFKEQACDACHFEAAVNTKPGQLTLSGVPDGFVAGERYALTITLSRPGMAMGGFQLSARMENGAQAGTLAPAQGEEKRIKIETGAVQYANQRVDGTALVEPGMARWRVVWTAPMTAGGKVVFHAAANAADKDEAARGDYIYTATAQSQALQIADPGK